MTGQVFQYCYHISKNVSMNTHFKYLKKFWLPKEINVLDVTFFFVHMIKRGRHIIIRIIKHLKMSIFVIIDITILKFLFYRVSVCNEWYWLCYEYPSIFWTLIINIFLGIRLRIHDWSKSSIKSICMFEKNVISDGLSLFAGVCI